MRKQGLIVLAAAAALTIVVIVALSVVLTRFNPTLEAAASGALGMEVGIGGRTGIGFLPGFHLVLRDVQVRNRGVNLLAAQSVEIHLGLLALLRREALLEKVIVRQPSIHIRRDKDGRFSFEPVEAREGPRPALELPAVSVSGASLEYADPQSGASLEMRECDAEVRNFRDPGGERSGFLRQLSLDASLDCEVVKTPRLAATRFRAGLAAKAGVLSLDPLTLRLFGGDGTGRLQLDHGGEIPEVRVNFQLAGFRIEEYLESLQQGKVVEGVMQFTAGLRLQGLSGDALKRSASGSLELRGNDLTLYGTDLDGALADYRETQAFDLVDMSALFLAGPVGLALSKGKDFGSLLVRSGGSSRIRTMLSTWRMENAVAMARDVALATNENRLALRGGLDFVGKRYSDVTVAVVDPKGCPQITQRIHGPFEDPTVAKPDFVIAVAAPVINLFKKAKDLVAPEPCEPFYSGSVPHPPGPSP